MIEIEELITGYPGGDNEPKDPKYIIEQGVIKIPQFSNYFLNAKETFDVLYDNFRSRKINENRKFPDLSLPFELDPKSLMKNWLSRGEFVIDVVKDEKRIGTCIIHLLNSDERKNYSNKLEDRLKWGYITWKDPIFDDKTNELIGDNLRVMFAIPVPTNIDGVNDVKKQDRFYGIYNGKMMHVQGKASFGPCMKLNEFGSENKGFHKIINFPDIGQNSIEVNSLNVPLYTSWARIAWVLDNPHRYSK